MKIKELLARDITATIDPVIYFHQKNPETLAREVGEYVITSKNDREETGIHEQYVKLLKAMSSSLGTDEKNPASWISGFFGSGKSSFAKLLGLSFGEIKLPSGKLLSDALIERDDTPNAHEFGKVWKECKEKFGNTIAVVFDISAEAKSLELPSSVIYRQIQVELGYSNKEAVARYELALQKEGKYELFLQKYREHYKNEWKNEKDKSKSPDEFSYIYHLLYPNEFPRPTDWFKTHYNNQALKEVEAIRRAASDIKDMIEISHPGKRLLVVIDEMSQFIGKNTDRMLNLQTFVSEIGSLSGNPIWLFVTGQEKLEDNVPGIEISKMQDRFPAKFRVHLHKTNVNEIVRRRILKKSDDKISQLKSLFNQETISKIKNNGYNSEQVTQEELIDFYPLLPSYVPLLLEISQSIKFYSAKAQADSASVRSVLQTIYDLFNSERTNFKDKELGSLVTMKDVYDIIGSALGSEIALTIDSITNRLSHEMPHAVDIARIIAILEMNSEKEPVTRELVQRMLYSHVNEPAAKELITQALERLDKENFIYLEDKRGYRIKDTVAQEWGKDKARLAVSEEEISFLVNQFSNEIFESMARPKMFDIPIELEISHKGKVEKNKPLPKVRLDLHYRADGLYDATKDYFISESQKEFPNNYSKERFILFVPGDTDKSDSLARMILQSEKMLNLHKGNLSKGKQKVYDDEKRKVENDKDRFKKELLQCWATGKLYFLGREYVFSFNNSSDQFLAKVRQQLESYLPEIYTRFRDAQVNVTQREIEKLFETEIISPSPALLDGSDGLSILTRQAGKYEPIADRGIPQRILDFIKDKVSVKGEFLLGYFGSQPFGYPQNVIQAVVVGLLRAETIKIKQANGREATSYKDEGIKDTLLNSSSFKQIELQSNQDIEIGPRDKKQCAEFFVDVLGFAGVAVDNNSIHEAIFKHFPSLVESVLDLNNRISKLSLPLPAELLDLHRNLDLCRRDKSVAGSVKMLKNLLPELKEGILLFREAKTYFTPESEERIRKFISLKEHEIRQLGEIEEDFALEEDIQKIQKKLGFDKPWKDLADLVSSYDSIQTAYKEIRMGIITRNQQEVESAYYQVQTRRGFDSLSDNEKQEIKSILESSLQSQDSGSLYPTLLFIRNLGNQIERDKARANDLLDEFLHRKEVKLEIRKVTHNLTNKDISTEEDLRKVLSELESKCLSELGKGYSIRLV